MDSAQINLINNKKGHLRLLHVISSCLLNYNNEEIETGKTWYEQHAGFKPITIKKWPLVPRKNVNKFETISQDIESYKKAIHFVRNFKLNEIIKYLTNQQKMHLNAMIDYNQKYKFDQDTKIRISKEAEKYQYECKQNIYSQNRRKRGRKRKRRRSRSRSISPNNDESRSRSRNRKKMDKVRNLKIESKLPLITVHDLCRRVHCAAFHAPTKWRKLLGQRHLRILYDILIDPAIISKKKNNAFLNYDRGRKYLQNLQQIINFRVFCRGKHKNDRIEGTIRAKNITKYQINKFNQSFKSTLDVYKKERKENREK